MAVAIKVFDLSGRSALKVRGRGSHRLQYAPQWLPSLMIVKSIPKAHLCGVKSRPGHGEIDLGIMKRRLGFGASTSGGRRTNTGESCGQYTQKNG